MQDFILPDIGEGIVECEVVKWLVTEGQNIKEDQPVVEVMTDKALVEIPAKYSGVVSKLYYAEGDIAKVHSPLFAMEIAGETPAAAVATQEDTPAPETKAPEPATMASDNSASGKALASPAVRRLARELDIDLSQVAGSGEKGIGLLEVIGFAWAANSITHFGLIDMALLRFAKKKSYGLATSTGMLFGHYVAWISAGIMGAGAAVILGKSIVELDPGDVAYYALGWSGFVIVIVAGWTTAITNLYRAGLAAQAVFSNQTSRKTTLIVGIVMVIIACFPFVFSQILPLLTYAGLLVVPVGAIVFAEHQIFPRIGYTRYWSSYKQLTFSMPAVAAWGLGLIFGFGLNFLDVISFYYLFIPTWFFTIAVYTLLASKYGAKETYAEEAKEEEVRQETIERFQVEQAKNEPVISKDVSMFSKGLKFIAISALVATLILACNVLFGSATEANYIENRELFYTYAFVCTIIYFVLAYWALKRGKSNKVV